jgi:hypothetical protein
MCRGERSNDLYLGSPPTTTNNKQGGEEFQVTVNIFDGSSYDKSYGDRGSYLPVYKCKSEGEVNSMTGQMMTHYIALRQHFNINVINWLSAHPRVHGGMIG